ncbi:hypothetical protein F4694_004292 [Bacillus niacini]|uniref:Uncharacterized protein n=1 Tax=Neobacillus niacini TaxID=86668 RepID=A0A852TGZ4_9BACI|nr:hypothetical protein [Neobacillus niacini]
MLKFGYERDRRGIHFGESYFNIIAFDQYFLLS